MKRLAHYLERYLAGPALITEVPSQNLRGIVVIPCYDEPDWGTTLHSLLSAQPVPEVDHEILLVVNASQTTPQAIMEHQKVTLREAHAYASQRLDASRRIHVIPSLDLAPKHAGVGWARKIGMDEGLRRLALANALDCGYLICLDADCTVREDYFQAIHDHFQQNIKTPGCSLHFEHALADAPSQNHRLAAAAYECHLRYYVEALRFAGFPHAYHTIGSAMAVRPEAYMKQGGMNRRKAGEDFYFLNKIMLLGGFSECLSTVVYPSPRASQRVPFGTGQAVLKNMQQSQITTYAWDSFLEIKATLAYLRQQNPLNLLKARNSRHLGYSEAFQAYLDSGDQWHALGRCGKDARNASTYQKNLFAWFDGFQCMKYLHFLRDHSYPDTPLKEALASLHRAISPSTPFDTLQAELLWLQKRQQTPLAEQMPGSTQNAYSKKQLS